MPLAIKRHQRSPRSLNPSQCHANRTPSIRGLSTGYLRQAQYKSGAMVTKGFFTQGSHSTKRRSQNTQKGPAGGRTGSTLSRHAMALSLASAAALTILPAATDARKDPKLSINWLGKRVPLHDTEANVFCYGEHHIRQRPTFRVFSDTVLSAPIDVNHIVVLEYAEPTSGTPQPILLAPPFEEMLSSIGAKRAPKKSKAIKAYQETHGNIYSIVSDHQQSVKSSDHIYLELVIIYRQLLKDIIGKQEEGSALLEKLKSSSKKDIIMKQLRTNKNTMEKWIGKARALNEKIKVWNKQRKVDLELRDKMDLETLKETLIHSRGMPRDKPVIIHIFRGESHLTGKYTQLRNKCSHPPYFSEFARQASQEEVESQKTEASITALIKTKKVPREILEEQKEIINTLEKSIVDTVVSKRAASESALRRKGAHSEL